MGNFFRRLIGHAVLGEPAQDAEHDESFRDRLLQRLAERGSPDAEGSRNGMMARGPFALPAGAAVQRDIAYGADPAQRLDVYRPAHAEGVPVIFMVHGGGWSRGDKGLWRSVKNKVLHWVGHGCVFVSVNYRMLPQAHPLEQASDVAAALAFVQDHARAWGGDPARVVLMGHSSGAHLVSLIAANPALPARQGAGHWLGTVAIDSAAYDVVEIMGNEHFGLYDKAFGNDPAYWREVSPRHCLTAKLASPLLAVCSSQRADSCAQAEAFAERALALGGDVSVLPMDLSHGDINDLLGAPGAYTESVDAFLRTLGLT